MYVRLVKAGNEICSDRVGEMKYFEVVRACGKNARSGVYKERV